MKPQKKTQRTFTRRMIAEQPMVGPDHGGGPFMCIRCGKSFLNGDRWCKIWAADGSYCVGVHDACHHLAQADGVR